MDDSRIREIAIEACEDEGGAAWFSSVERAIRTALAEYAMNYLDETRDARAAWEDRIRAEVWREAAKMAREEEELRRGSIVGAQFGFFACELEEKVDD